MKTYTALVLALAAGLAAQTPPAKSILGTISSIRAESAELEVTPESGPATVVRISSLTIAKRIAPGQTDLSKAETIGVTDVAKGDRVLVSLGPDGSEARRIVVIPATDIAKRDAADRADWQRRGVSGVVTAVAGNELSVESRSLAGATKYTVTAGPKTSFKRYASDSVRFADAKAGALTDIAAGDQLRARGTKSPDGMKLDAEEVVSGAFLSKAGTITAVNPEAREITIKDLSNNKLLVVRFIPESQVKRMPDTPAGRGPGPGVPGPGGASPGGAGPAGAGRGGAGPGGAGPGRGAGGPDIAQILEQLPPVKVEDLKPGEIVVVSAIRGVGANQITAITFLANAEKLVQLAMAARGAGANGPAPSLAGLAGSISNVGP